MQKVIFGFVLSFLSLSLCAQQLPTNNFTYLIIDSTRTKWGDYNEPEWLRYFGLSFQDVDHDGLTDIVSGRYIYHNPGGLLKGPWPRTDIGINADAMVSIDVDNDQNADFIAQALPNVYWFEADDENPKTWKHRVIGNLPATGHNNGQGYGNADVFKGGKEEILLTASGGVYCFEIPHNTSVPEWKKYHLVHTNTDEGFACADMDGDGDQDIIAGSSETDGEHATILSWYENPGRKTGNWKARFIGTTVNAIDRLEAEDLNGDGRIDVAVAEEQYPPEGPTAFLFWYEQKEEPIFERHTVVQQWSLHNLDIADMDQDGDPDLITSEHKGPDPKLQIWENNGEGVFTEILLDQGKESHLGTQVIDLDNDGDLDIVSTSWDYYQFLHAWRNDAIMVDTREPYWQKVSNLNFDFPVSKTGSQVASLIADLDKDGINDFVIAAYTGIEWYKMTKNGNMWSGNPEISWDQYVIDYGDEVHIEAGGVVYDIDNDNDLDILMGGSGKSNEVWWWENPWPDFKPGNMWNRYLIKSEGQNQHHDQIIDDFDGDGKGELFFWNQGAKKLFVSDIPNNPKRQEEWLLKEVFSWEGANFEGFASADVNLDGVTDLIGGGYWFEYDKREGYIPHKLDDYPTSRSAAGDLIKGGRPEILIGSGDLTGPLNMYYFHEEEWQRKKLIPSLKNGHTLQIADLNNDGNQDIYTAEMHSPGAGDAARQIILYGNGKGNFRQVRLSTGSGTHEGKTGDLDGDGDIDVLQKDFNRERRVNIWLNQGAFTEKNRVTIVEVFYKGGKHYKITTENAIYFLEKSSGGLSALIDRSGNDWIQWSESGNVSVPESAGSDFRGLPNMVYGADYDNGAGHPGFNVVSSTEILNDHEIIFTSTSGNFVWQWSFYPDHAQLSVLKAPEDQNYWFLYEGPVGGNYNPFTKYWGSNKGMHMEIPDFLSGGTLEDMWNWVYFGDYNQNRVFFAAHLENDEKEDVFGYMGASSKKLHATDGMLVFGFGRNRKSKTLLNGTNTFIIGFYGQKIDSREKYNGLKVYIDSLLNP